MGGSRKPERDWAIWRAYRTGQASQPALTKQHGLSQGPVNQAVGKGDRLVRAAMGRSINLPVSEELREGTLGVEFVFTHEALLSPSERQDWQYIAPPRQWRGRVAARRLHDPDYDRAHALDNGIVYRVVKK